MVTMETKEEVDNPKKIVQINNSKDINDSNFNLKDLLIKLEKTLIPIVDYLNENEVVIQTSGKIWNQLFSVVNSFNKTKKIIFDLFDIPRSEDIWKTIYEAEKINMQLYLRKLQIENEKKTQENKISYLEE